VGINAKITPLEITWGVVLPLPLWPQKDVWGSLHVVTQRSFQRSTVYSDLWVLSYLFNRYWWYLVQFRNSLQYTLFCSTQG